MASQISGASEVAVHVYQSLFGQAPSNPQFDSFVSEIGTSGSGAWANEMAAGFASLSDLAFTDLVMANLGISSQTALHDPLMFYFGAAGVAARGLVVMQLSEILSNLSGDPTFGTQADAFNSQALADFTYASDAGNVNPGDPGAVDTTLFLTEHQDPLTGSSLADIFTANVVQNSLGEQVNTLGSGDVLFGQGGTDTLNAKITAGVFAGGGSGMPIQPETTGVEVVKLEAVNSHIGYSGTNVNLDVASIMDALGNADAIENGVGGILDTIDSLPDSITILNLVENYEVSTTEVYVNAKDMRDVHQLWSDHSDANLTIQNLTTVGLDNLSDMTIGMAYTGNADSHWEESDMTVYFDQDYLTPEGTRTRPTVDFMAMNEDNYDDNPAAPLDGVFFRELQFRLNGETFVIANSVLGVNLLGEDPQGTGSEIKTYADFLVHVQAALVVLKAANPGNAALQSVTAILDGQFHTDANPDTLILREGTAVQLSVDGLTGGVPNFLDVQSTDLEVARAEHSLVENNNRYELADANPATPGDRLAINVALEKVGLAGDGGELIIGSMNKTDANEWDAVTTVTDTTSGIEEFNVTVYGANDKSSSLAGLHSTNNNLRVVTVVTDPALTDPALIGDSFADLRIGNSNTDGDLGAIPQLDNQYALKDVQTFDASGFKGDLTLFAALTEEVTPKYLNLVDQAPDAPALDNVAFEYTGGTGNDYFNIALSASNDAFLGSVTREDFNMSATVAGGDGNDMITLAIVGEPPLSSIYDSVDENGLAYGKGSFSNPNLNGTGYANWYDNQKLNANLRIDGGAGDDTIWKPGSGDVIIDAGTGNDTVYADNTGLSTYGGKVAPPTAMDKMAVWAFNVADPSILSRSMLANLQSDVNNSYNLFKTDVSVSFLGFEANAAIVDTNGVATDLDINQAIKQAINSDPVLSKLLEATDGPANTLVVSSLIDGNMVGELTIGLEGPVATDLSAGNVNQLITWYGSTYAGTTAAGFATLFGAQIVLFGANADYAENFARDSVGNNGNPYEGGDSIHVSDNTITGDLGNDVLVLGTGAYSNDTVVYENFGNGNDTIVNFDTTSIPGIPAHWDNNTSHEVVKLTFSASDGDPFAETIIFDGVTVNLAAPTLQGIIPSLDVASQFVNQYNAAAATNGWVATLGSANAGSAGTFETATMTGNGGLVVGATYTVAGLTFTATAATTQAQLLAAFASLADGAMTGAGVGTGTYSGALTGYATGVVVGNTVTFTNSAVGNVAPDLTDSGTGATAAAIAVTLQGTPVTVAGHDVTLTHDVPGATPDLTPASFTGNYFAAFPGLIDGNGVVTVNVTTQGVDNVGTAATSSTFAVTYTTATTAVTAAGDAAITNPVALALGDGALTAANTAAAAPPPGFNAGTVTSPLDGSSYTVAFVAQAPGVTPLPTDVSYGMGATPLDGVNGTFTGTAGTAAIMVPPVWVPATASGPGTGLDYLDFSAYNAEAVIVNNATAADQAFYLAAAGQQYVLLKESTTNDGEYTMSLYTEAGATDTLIGTIGIADFGATQEFVAANFII